MKIILQTEKDVMSLTGKWIIQLNCDNPDETITEGNWGFMKEKRLSFVVGLRTQGFYYQHGKDKNTWEDFVEYFNNPSSGDRFHRLLTSKELDFMNKKLKEDNF
jgi:hypothetical protein